MPLKTLVKVGNISNLSDARYCSGMGVDMLGFCAVENMPAYLAPKLYQEIRGWVTGPSVVAEIYGLTDPSLLASIIQNYVPDYLEVGIAELEQLGNEVTLPLIVSIENEAEAEKLTNWKEKINYIQVKEANASLIKSLGKLFKVLVSLQSEQLPDNLLEELPVAGIALSGSAEIRPGFKDYDNLADVLEQLEVD